MKKLILLTILIILLSACSSPDNQADGPTIDDILADYQKPGEGEAAIPDEPLPTNDAECYEDGEHPIGVSIAEQFPAITTYEEVMHWFCNGALFEDILNALATEELTSIDADEILHMIAGGQTWNEVWLELGVTEE